MRSPDARRQASASGPSSMHRFIKINLITPIALNYPDFSSDFALKSKLFHLILLLFNVFLAWERLISLISKQKQGITRLGRSFPSFVGSTKNSFAFLRRPQCDSTCIEHASRENLKMHRESIRPKMAWSTQAWFWQSWQLKGRYCSYLLVRLDGRTSQRLFNGRFLLTRWITL